MVCSEMPGETVDIPSCPLMGQFSHASRDLGELVSSGKSLPDLGHPRSGTGWGLGVTVQVQMLGAHS